MIDRVRATIHLDHLWHNYHLLQYVHQDKKMMAVVKADAYGHGAKNVATHLEKMGCAYFAVTDMIEGIELREAGIQSTILILGKTSPKHVEKLHEYQLTQTIDALTYANDLNKQGFDIDTHIILDTGMSRFGIYCHRDNDLDQTVKEVKAIFELKHLHQKGIYTHFAAADEEQDVVTKQQFDIFKKVCDRLTEDGYDLGLKHCSNSASILKFSNHQMDMVRTGIAMYGYPPVLSSLDFLPVMQIDAKVIAIRHLLEGDGISYGLTHKVEKPMKVASIAIGYADGYNRLFSNQDYFIYQGQKLRVVGRVCMGITMVDVTDVDIFVGEYVEVFGLNKSLEMMAKNTQTITYELLTNMSKKRVKFVYKS